MEPGTRTPPQWRSLLFVPVLNERFVGGAARRGADAIVLDLEDSIPPDHKGAARARLMEAVRTIRAGGSQVVVRINRSWRHAVRDLEAAVSGEITAVLVPKVPNAGHVRAIAEVLDELEAERGLAAGAIGLVPMIESASGLLEVAAIATASRRSVALALGTEDLALSLGIEPEAEALQAPGMAIVAAARAVGILPLGTLGSIADFADREAFARASARARRLGFAGGFAIHPDQVSALNAAFSPRPEEVAEAEAIVAAFELAVSAGNGVAQVAGRMVDLPVVERARRLLAQHQAGLKRP